MEHLVLTTTTGKTVNVDKIKFDLVSRDKTKGDFHIIFDDDSEIYLTDNEYLELHRQCNEFRKASRESHPSG